MNDFLPGSSGVARRPTSAFAGQGIGFGRQDLTEPYLTFEARLERAELGTQSCREFGVRLGFHFLAARNRLLQDLDVVQGGEYLGTRRIDANFFFEFQD